MFAPIGASIRNPMIELAILVIGSIVGYILVYKVPHPDTYTRMDSWNKKRRKKMSSWNYRLVKNVDGDLVVYYAIHEVYYDDKKHILTWTESPVSANNFETPKEVKSTLHMMLEAFDKPTLELDKDGKLVEVE